MSDEAARDEATLRQILRTRTDAVTAAQRGIQLAVRSGGMALGTAIGLGVGAAIGEYAVSQAALEVKTWSQGTLTTGWQLCGAITAFLVLYALIQITKRDTATIESWLPALFTLPALCVTGALAFANGSTIPITEVLFINAFVIVYAMIAGAPALVLWIRTGRAAADGVEHDLGETLLAVQAQYQQLMVIRGTKFQAIIVGIQVILPGIFYALQLAFAEIIAVLQPQRPALRRSGQLTWGMRGRLFRLLAVFVIPSNLLLFGILVAMGVATGEGTASEMVGIIFQGWFVNPAGLGFSKLLVQDVLSMVVWWATLMSMLVLFDEREAQIQAKRELKQLLADEPAEEPVASDASPA